MDAIRIAAQSVRNWPARRGPTRLLLALLVLSAGSLAVLAAEPQPATMRLVVDHGDGVETHYKALTWREGMTVLDALNAAKSHRRALDFNYRGSGSSALITTIADQANEGGGAKSKNWLFYVNDKLSTMGAGMHELQPGDHVLWKFQVYDYNSDN